MSKTCRYLFTKINSLTFRRLFKRGFSLVELIIVIVILAVLSALAFMMVSKWIGNSRDSRRKTDLSVVNQGFSLYISDHSIYPDPDDYVEIKDPNGAIGWYQGEFKDGVKQFLSGMKKTPKDPQGDYYGYSITADKKKYQLRALTENGDAISFIGDRLYAGSFYGYFQGNYDGYLIATTGGQYHLYQVPTLFVDESYLSGFVLGTGSKHILQPNADITQEYEVKAVDVSDLFDGDPSNDTAVLTQIVSTFSGTDSSLQDTSTAYRIVQTAPGSDPTTFSATPPAGESGGTTPESQVPPTISTITDQYFSRNVAMSQGFSGYVTATNSDAITGYQLSGTLPAGLSFDTVGGILSGTPTTVGTGTYQLRAGDNDGWSNWSNSFIINIGVCGDGIVQEPEKCDGVAGCSSCNVAAACLNGSDYSTCPVCTFGKTTIGYCKFQ